jgi:integrase
MMSLAGSLIVACSSENRCISMQSPHKKLLDQACDAIRVKQYAYRTEETYVQWLRRYILFHNKRHPKEMGKAEIEVFLTHIAVEGQVSASTQNQAFSAFLFLYREVLNLEMLGINAFQSRQPQYVPTVLTKEEAIAVIYCSSFAIALLLSAFLRTFDLVIGWASPFSKPS